MSVLAVMMDGGAQIGNTCSALQDRAFHYGDGLFETIAVLNGKPLFWQEHILRMQAGAALLRITPPDPLHWWDDFEKLQQVFPEPERYVLKLVLSRGSGWGYGFPQGAKPSRFVFAAAWPVRSLACWHPGISTEICPLPLLTGAPYLRVKSLNRLNQIMARNALSPDYPEGIMLDTHGFLREGIMSNLFWVSAGVVYTPSLEAGGITGIQRNATLEWLQAEGIPSQVGDYRAESLLEAEEIFFSNSLIGIWPVQGYRNRILPGDQGRVSAKILSWQHTLGLGVSL